MKFLPSLKNFSLLLENNAKKAYKDFVETKRIRSDTYDGFIANGAKLKYVYWLCREYDKLVTDHGNTAVQYLTSLLDVTKQFDILQIRFPIEKRDIYKMNFFEVKKMIEELEPSNRSKKKSSHTLSRIVEMGSDIIFEKKDGTVLVHVTNKEAAVYWAHYYMKDTVTEANWCISSEGPDNMFREYSKVDTIYIFILPNLINSSGEEYVRFAFIGYAATSVNNDGEINYIEAINNVKAFKNAYSKNIDVFKELEKRDVKFKNVQTNSILLNSFRNELLKKIPNLKDIEINTIIATESLQMSFDHIHSNFSLRFFNVETTPMYCQIEMHSGSSVNMPKYNLSTKKDIYIVIDKINSLLKTNENIQTLISTELKDIIKFKTHNFHFIDIKSEKIFMIEFDLEDKTRCSIRMHHAINDLEKEFDTLKNIIKEAISNYNELLKQYNNSIIKEHTQRILKLSKGTFYEFIVVILAYEYEKDIKYENEEKSIGFILPIASKRISGIALEWTDSPKNATIKSILYNGKTKINDVKINMYDKDISITLLDTLLKFIKN